MDTQGYKFFLHPQLDVRYIKNAPGKDYGMKIKAELTSLVTLMRIR